MSNGTLRPHSRESKHKVHVCTRFTDAFTHPGACTLLDCHPQTVRVPSTRVPPDIHVAQDVKNAIPKHPESVFHLGTQSGKRFRKSMQARFSAIRTFVRTFNVVE